MHCHEATYNSTLPFSVIIMRVLQVKGTKKSLAQRRTFVISAKDLLENSSTASHMCWYTPCRMICEQNCALERPVTTCNPQRPFTRCDFAAPLKDLADTADPATWNLPTFSSLGTQDPRIFNGCCRVSVVIVTWLHVPWWLQPPSDYFCFSHIPCEYASSEY